MKVKIFSSGFCDVLEEMVNNFISTVNVVDIKFSTRANSCVIVIMYLDK